MTRRPHHRRTRINPATEAAVLLKSARRCCLCCHLRQDFTEKHGQIAHLDKNPANGAEENLAYLCLEHHSLYDSTTSQHKNYTFDEVTAARARLYHRVSVLGFADVQAANTPAHGAASRAAFLTATAARAEHERLNAEWKQICREKKRIDRDLRRHLGAQDVEQAEYCQQKMELLFTRISEIVERQFAIEQELFRL